jgi:hypothetical protein
LDIPLNPYQLAPPSARQKLPGSVIYTGDTEFLGKLDPNRRSNWNHTKNILLNAEKLGFQNILLPTFSVFILYYFV